MKDANDILREDGVEALRAEFDSMKPFEPEQGCVNGNGQRHHNDGDDDFAPDEPALKAKRKKPNGTKTAVGTNDGVQPPAFSDDAIALSFADLHADKLRYVVKWSWMLWNGTHWQSDGKLKHYDYARSICREAAASCNSKFRKGLASNKTVAAVVQMARSDRRLVSTVEQWGRRPLAAQHARWRDRPAHRHHARAPRRGPDHPHNRGFAQQGRLPAMAYLP